MCLLADLCSRPKSLVVDGEDEALVLDHPFGFFFVEAPLVGRAYLLNNPFGGKGGEDLLTMSLSGGWSISLDASSTLGGTGS